MRLRSWYHLLVHLHDLHAKHAIVDWPGRQDSSKCAGNFLRHGFLGNSPTLEFCICERWTHPSMSLMSTCVKLKSPPVAASMVSTLVIASASYIALLKKWNFTSC